jgi:hypothetical protein
MTKKFTVLLLVTVWLLLTGIKAFPQDSSLKVYVVNSGGDSLLNAATIQKLTELKPQLSQLKIVSFECYMTAAGYHDNTVIFNEGAIFNASVLHRLKYVRPYTILVFDNIKVTNEQGLTLLAHPLILRAQ